MTAPRAEAIARTLAERIVDGEIAPGERLPSEGRLVEEFGASRSVIREALQRLQSRGLVRTRVGSGSYALTPPAPVAGDDWLAARSETERAELHAFRLAIETEAAALAARRASDGDLAAVEAAAAALEDAADPAESVEADFAFHRAVAAASGNRYLLASLERVGARAIVVTHARIDPAQHDGVDAAAALAEHRSVADAIRSGDPLGAAAAMRAHLTASASRRRG
ncbi:FadR/GntR family transcriptional regulator [Humibacter sp. RRB41]|uniref:FadR/GntR family transcriptional regulator n=1 Tax=Humibacter sp. RRB41 TaxID=2919946 RepID=UPI001FAB1A6D|nr:FCD domain-containing protein [Humibacter sp. RRB41]